MPHQHIPTPSTSPHHTTTTYSTSSHHHYTTTYLITTLRITSPPYHTPHHSPCYLTKPHHSITSPPPHTQHSLTHTPQPTTHHNLPHHNPKTVSRGGGTEACHGSRHFQEYNPSDNRSISHPVISMESLRDKGWGLADTRPYSSVT